MPWNEKTGEYECKVGRPSMGVTKKVSVTLPEEVWEFIEEFESKSSYFRYIASDDFKQTQLIRKSVRV
jgi:hypothetical protein